MRNLGRNSEHEDQLLGLGAWGKLRLSVIPVATYASESALHVHTETVRDFSAWRSVQDCNIITA